MNGIELGVFKMIKKFFLHFKDEKSCEKCLLEKKEGLLYRVEAWTA